MKKWTIILASVLALIALIVTPFSVMAAGQDATGFYQSSTSSTLSDCTTLGGSCWTKHAINGF